MYARKENGKIKTYGSLPSKFRGVTGNYAGGFDKLESYIHEEEGFYPLVQYTITQPKVFRYGELVFAIDHYEYTIVPIYPLITLSEAKVKRIKELKQIVYQKFEETRWYYDRADRTEKIKDKVTKNVPADVFIKDKVVYDTYDAIEIEINALLTIEDVLEYEINL
jgi:hypothetical protein